MGEDILGENGWTGESSARALVCSKILKPTLTTQYRAFFVPAVLKILFLVLVA
jgi:hypothetical protein